MTERHKILVTQQEVVTKCITEDEKKLTEELLELEGMKELKA